MISTTTCRLNALIMEWICALYRWSACCKAFKTRKTSGTRADLPAVVSRGNRPSSVLHESHAYLKRCLQGLERPNRREGYVAHPWSTQGVSGKDNCQKDLQRVIDWISPHKDTTSLPVISSAKCLKVSRKIMSRWSGFPSSNFFCKYRQPC